MSESVVYFIYVWYVPVAHVSSEKYAVENVETVQQKYREATVAAREPIYLANIFQNAAADVRASFR